VNVLSRVVSTKPSPNDVPAPQQDRSGQQPNTVHTNHESLQRTALEAVATLLQSLVDWAGRGVDVEETVTVPPSEKDDSPRPSVDVQDTASIVTTHTLSTITDTDDPEQFNSQKYKKQTLQEGIKLFGWKPKRGMKMLLDTKCIPDKSPESIASFLLKTPGLSKVMIGEYLGEMDAANIAIMHAFVDLMDFKGLPFVTALRNFLQTFRLPGEAQKIDRFMLKFAERYVTGNPAIFANADTAYVLAYSVIMLNTDLHNPQVKNRMTLQDFIKNNRGINDNADLPQEFLEEIYEEIDNNEIRMKDEMAETSAKEETNPLAVFNPFANRSRMEAYVLASEEIANKTEAVLKGILKRKARLLQAEEKYYNAFNFQHVRPMFEIVWMPILAALSSPLQASDDLESVKFALEGFGAAVHIISLFDMELARNAFISTLAKFTLLNSVNEMKVKNVHVVKCILGIALVEGNTLGGCWYDILSCVSQLERLQTLTPQALFEDELHEKRQSKPTGMQYERNRQSRLSVHLSV
jgi:brefeldin A-inhibited guanine nucleotide-exchange protein